MRNFIKAIAIILLLAFILCACGAEETETVPVYDNEIGSERDMNGQVIRWGFGKSLNDEENVFGFIPGTAFADMALERQREIEKTYNCSIVMTYKDLVSNLDDNLYATISGNSIYDILNNESIKLINHIRAGYILPLSGLLDITNTEKWGTPNMLLSLVWNNDLYGVLPYAWPELMYSSFGYLIAVNENLVSQFGLGDPREYVEKNEWTWDKFEEVLHDYTRTEGERTVYGMATHSAYFAMMMFLSNGVGVSDYIDGQVVAGAYTDAGFEALTRAQKIYTETCRDCFHPENATYGSLNAFKAGESVMATAHASYASGFIGHDDSIMYVMDNVGVLPYPVGPNAEPGVYKGYHESMYFTASIPITSGDYEAAAFIIDAMFEPFKGFETKESIVEYMTKQFFFDERDTRVFMNCLRYTEYGFYIEGARDLIAAAVDSSTPISQLLERYQDKYDKIVEDYMVNHYNSMISIFGEQ